MIPIGTVIETFKSQGVYLLARDVEYLGDFSDKFNIQQARTLTGNIFQGKYNATTNSLYDIEYEGTLINGSFGLNEINSVFNYSKNQPDDSKEENLSNEVVKNSLSLEIQKRTIIDIFKKLGFTLELFEIYEDQNKLVRVETIYQNKSLTFSLNADFTEASKITINATETISGAVQLKVFKQVVDDFILQKEEEEKIRQVKIVLESIRLMLDQKNIQKVEGITEELYQIKNIYEPQNKILFEGQYNLNQKLFAAVDLGELGVLQNIGLDQLVEKISQLKIENEQAKMALLEQETSTGTLIEE